LADRTAAATGFLAQIHVSANPCCAVPTHIFMRENRTTKTHALSFLTSPNGDRPMPLVAEQPQAVRSSVPANELLLSAAIGAVESAFAMCNITTRCVGVSTVPLREQGAVTGMIGVHGKVSGFITVNMNERVAARAVGGLIGEDLTELNAQVVDGTGEITNLVVGGIKSSLATSKWAFAQITVPSVIVGNGYSIAYSRSVEFLNVTFEHDDKEAIHLEDRLIQVSISLLTL
jgi:chemotaxis protein CheX